MEKNVKIQKAIEERIKHLQNSIKNNKKLERETSSRAEGERLYRQVIRDDSRLDEAYEILELVTKIMNGKRKKKDDKQSN